MSVASNDPIIRKPVTLCLKAPSIPNITAPGNDTTGRLARHAVKVERDRTNAEFLVASYIAALWFLGQFLGAGAQPWNDTDEGSGNATGTPTYETGGTYPPTSPFNLEAIYGTTAFAIVAFVLIAVPALVGIWRYHRTERLDRSRLHFDGESCTDIEPTSPTHTEGCSNNTELDRELAYSLYKDRKTNPTLN